jgi:hypothetical protein
LAVIEERHRGEDPRHRGGGDPLQLSGIEAKVEHIAGGPDFGPGKVDPPDEGARVQDDVVLDGEGERSVGEPKTGVDGLGSVSPESVR